MRATIDVSAIPAALTGAGRYVVELVTHLAVRDDIDITLLTRRDDTARWPSSATVVAAAPSARPLRLAWEQVALPRRLRALAPDVHHGPHYTMPERSAVPAVVTIHDMTFFDHPEWHERFKVPVFRRAITRAAGRAAALICDSETTADRFRERFPKTAAVHTVPLGVDHARFSPGGDADADLAALARVGVRPPYIAFVGTIEPRKGVGTLVRAFDALAARHPDLQLAIAGGRGWGDPGLDAALAEATHADRVRRLGYVDLALVPPLLRAAAVVAYPSHDEGFGLPVLEAMACGTPVVTTAGTVMEEVAGGAASLVPAGDPAALADALDGVLTGRGDVAHLRAAGIARAAGFTWDATAAAHVAVYRSVA